MIKKIVGYVWFYVAIVGLFLLPDVLFSLIKPEFKVVFSDEKILLVVGLALLFSFIKNKYAFVAMFAGWTALQVSQFGSMAYFGAVISPFAIMMIFLESADVAEETLMTVGKFWWAWLVLLIPYALFALVVLKARGRVRFRFAWVLPLLVLGGFMWQANTFSGSQLMPFKRTPFSAFNTMNSYGFFLGNVLPKHFFGEGAEKSEYKPYTLEKIPFVFPANVIVIMGEGINPDYMSLFGYGKDTTPKLVARAGTDKGFAYKKGFSGAVSTFVSVNTFLNVQREPLFQEKQVWLDTYLPKIAKESGFKVTYVGFQGKGLFEKSGIYHTDATFIYDNCEGLSFNGVKGEEGCFMDAFQRIDLSQPNFIFLNKRNIHGYYASNYSFDVARFGRFESEYDSGMFYEDYLLDRFFTYFAELTRLPTYIFYTSDHGEAQGKGGFSGHGHINGEEVFTIPFIYQVLNDRADEMVEKVQDMFYPTNYEIGRLVAEKLGVRVVNPNDDGKVYFVNGPDRLGRAGMIKITKDKDEGRVDFEKILP